MPRDIPPITLKGDDKTQAQDAICGLIADGIPLREICRLPGMPKWRTVYDWIRNDPDFASAMEAARLLGYDAIAEEALEIADTQQVGERIEKEKGKIVKVVQEDMLGHRKLQIETRLKLLAKWHPKKYGDKVTQEHTGPGGGAVQFEKITRTIVDPKKPEDPAPAEA